MTALDQFNAAFDFQFCEPLSADYLEKLVDYARLRGRDDIAQRLEADFGGISSAGSCELVEKTGH